MDNSSSSHELLINLEQPLTVLDSKMVSQIDRALSDVGAYGEVRLIIVNNTLRFIQIMHSERVQNHNNRKEVSP